MNKFYLDAHMHFDLYKNRNDILDYVEENRIYTIAMTNLPELYERYLTEYDWSKYKFCRLALGFHPELVCKYINQIAKFNIYITNARYVGEIGLDFKKSSNEEKYIQIEVFEKIMYECKRQGNKIISIHSRGAVDETLRIIGDVDNCKIIYHWYGGDESQLKRIIDKGGYLSVNHQMLNSMNGVKNVRKLPLDRLLLESDAPFTKGLSKQYSINFIDKIYEYLSLELKMSQLEISNIIKENFRRLLT